MAYSIQKKITKVNKGAAGANKPEWIIFHFVGAAGQAWGNANYFYSTYRGASAHYFVDPNNIVQVVPDTTPAWHIGDGSRTRRGTNNGYAGAGATNNNAIGIELCQDTSTGSNVWHWDFHPETLKKAEWLIKQKQKQYNIPDSRVIRHYDATTKMCPGNWQWNNWAKWKAFKKRLAGISAGAATGNPGVIDSKPAVHAKQHLVEIGETLSAIAKQYGVTVNELVKWNDLEDPDVIFPESYLFVEKPTSGESSGAGVDGQAGANLVKNENAYFLATEDIKVRNAPSVTAKHTGTLPKGSSINYFKVYEGNGYRWLQYTGNSGNTLYVPYRESGSGKKQWGTFHDSRPKGTGANLKVDGYLGPEVVKALQSHYGLIVDGEMWGQYSGNQATKAFNQKAVKYGKGGSPVVRELQKTIGVTADGIWGAGTTRALQRYLGTPVDGIVSRPSTAIKELQRRLNNGTF